ncbi:DUF7255 family protein [Naasia lichenicola]|uniref:Uncharacterized protein n=1 Tax=Naasia lichenicola TaxID=2565933 RepID=A0A4S4FSF3_9MICO|nr:hypothetical protein [Naasia lichenicola]THG33231.1 hypothetical protein E6C64_02430 [Naasia lichenicola]
MGQRATALEKLLVHAGLESTGASASFRMSDFREGQRDLAHRIFVFLGGVDERFEAITGPGQWDLTFTGGMVIELDEEQHFNRYRLETLTLLTQLGLPWEDAYESYCIAMEGRCARSGGWWSNPSAERLFGPSDEPGTFAGLGAARWKQRAFNDALKDIHETQLISRVSIYDEIEGRRLDSILKAEDFEWADRVLAFVRSRQKRAAVWEQLEEPEFVWNPENYDSPA